MAALGRGGGRGIQVLKPGSVEGQSEWSARNSNASMSPVGYSSPPRSGRYEERKGRLRYRVKLILVLPAVFRFYGHCYQQVVRCLSLAEVCRRAILATLPPDLCFALH